MKIKGVDIFSPFDLVPEDEERCYVVFQSTRIKRWYHRFIAKDFQHCFIVYWDGLVWYRLEKTYGYVDVKNIWQLDGYALGRDNVGSYYKHKGYDVLPVTLSKRDADKIRVPQIAVGNTCVEFVKDFIGMRAWWCFTPLQLYKRLLKDGYCSEG